MIPATMLPADENPEYYTDPGNATQDKIFLLSITEANKYFRNDEARMCVPTAFAIADCAYTDRSNNCRWWLRTPGSEQLKAAYIEYDGDIYCDGGLVYGVGVYVRPALWIDLES